MSISLLFLLLVPLLCTTHNLRYRSPPSSCPDHICECSEVPTARPQQQQQEAICTEMPTERLTKTITSLRVNGQITTITKRMIANLGGNLLSLDLSDCDIQSIEPGSFDAAPKLINLILSNNQIEEIGPGMFKKNKVLRELYLDGNKLKQIDESAFAKLEQLRELHVERNFLTQFPSKIPIRLTVLNVSHNNLGPSFACDVRETNIKDLDLCGNHLEQIENATLHALNKLQNLCIGDKAVHFSKNTAAQLPHLADLSLVASTENHAVLDPTTQAALGDMGTLTSLSIVNYKIESLSFLHSLTNLRYLTLQDITATHVVDFQSLMLSKTSLVVLNLEESHDLAHTLLDHMQVLGTLSALQTVSFRNTKITHLAAFDVPHTNHTQLDISKNPLLCDCGFAWLQNQGQNKSMRHFLLNSDETLCGAPSECVGKKLIDVINNLDCSSADNRDTRDSHPYNQHSSGRRKPTPHQPQPASTPIPDESHYQAMPTNHDDSDFQQDKDKWGETHWGHGRPPKFPTHPPQGSESEFPTHTDNEGEVRYHVHPNRHRPNGKPWKFPLHPSQGREPDISTYPPQGNEPESSIDPNHGSEPESTIDPNQGSEPESPINPHQSSEPESPIDPNHGGEQEFTVNPDQVEPETTSKPFSPNNELGKEHTEKEQSIPPTADPIHGIPEHMPIHDDDDGSDTSNIVYIILGTLLGLLVLVGLILSIFYWHVKKTGSNKVQPEPSVPSTTDGTTPIEPTYQQLQHNEGTSLIKNLKK